jgi:hypothetical protein
MSRKLRISEVLSGIIFIVSGSTFLYASYNLGIGNVHKIGGGFFPAAVSILLIVTGSLILISELWKHYQT